MTPEKNRLICDIIIPVWNQLKYTKECLDSLFKYTAAPFRLIIVDNASDSPTAQYLDKLKEENPDQISLIRNDKNLGFVKAVNQGIKQSRALYVCLLNNDTQLTPGWLSEMIKVAEISEDIGIVNPNSTDFGLNLRKGESPELVAQRLKSYAGEYSQLPWAIGFCMLIKRKVIDKIGLFDEIYGMGTFEDADFSKRAQSLGYICVCAKAAYVYHHAKRSFIKFKRFDQDFQRNRKIFFAKWGKTQRILYIFKENNPTHIKEIYREAIKLACKGNMIWIFLKGKNRYTLDSYSNTFVFNLPARFFNLISFWRIIKRKKKFDKIYVDQEGYAKFLHKFNFFHKAEVTYAE